MMFSYRLFKQGNDVLLAISDSAIIGKTLRKDDVEIEVSEAFYSGESCDETAAIELIQKATIVNAIGKEVINLMLKKRFIEKDKIMEIEGVPHAQIITIR